MRLKNLKRLKNFQKNPENSCSKLLKSYQLLKKIHRVKWKKLAQICFRGKKSVGKFDL